MRTKPARPRIDLPPVGTEAFLRYLRAALGARPQEALIAVYLDVHRRIVGTDLLAVGDDRHVPAPPPERIVEGARRFGARSVVLVHNHPDGPDGVGVARPSQADLAAARAAAAELRARGLTLWDEIIVTKDDAFSFRAAGLLPADAPAPGRDIAPALVGGLLGVGLVGLRAGMDFLEALVGPSGAAREALARIEQIFNLLIVSATLRPSAAASGRPAAGRPDAPVDAKSPL